MSTPQEVDVLICGSGSAGLAAATWLSVYGISSVKILERRDGPMTVGQADGVQCRTVEIFESWGMSEELLRESYHVVEVAFWSTVDKDGQRRLQRNRYTADTQPGLSHQPHVILNQARINGLMIEKMKKTNGQTVDYGYEIKNVEVDGELAAKDPMSKAVTVVTETDGKEEIYKARFVLGCDGAHSAVRHSLGYKMVGDSTDSVWGVMDVYPRTNFPDIRKKATLHSDAGAVLIIPREGGELVRFYVEMPQGTNPKKVKLEDLQDHARKVFGQYNLEIVDTFWWSAYSIGQRLADHFSKDNRVFLTGDACHTHSPKAGQGMNTSLQDGFNIGWKLGAILRGQAEPELLKTYNIEREKTASELIEFDRRWTKTFSSKTNADHKEDPEHFSREFIQAGKYTAGLTARYADSVLTSTQHSDQSVAKNIIVGMRFPSAQVVRFCDADAIQLMRTLKSDGRFRIVVFPGNIQDLSHRRALENLGDYLQSPQGPIHTITPRGADFDSKIESLVVLSGDRHKIEQEDIHPAFYPVTGKYGINDLHKVFSDDMSYNHGHGHAYETFGVDPKEGAIVIVRPDQYVAKVVALDNIEAIGDYFRGFALPQN